VQNVSSGSCFGDAVASSRHDRTCDVLVTAAALAGGLSQAEAATALGISPGAASIRLHRARKRALSALEKREPGGPDTNVTTLYSKEQAS
jgi:hypothetical protein